MRKNLILITLLIISNIAFAQSDKPKLVIGIVVDQMRYEYLKRFQAHYSEDGFKTLMKEGFFAKNTHFSYIPTYTGPGHASVFTGTTPANHGIIANNWYDKEINETVYCVQDDNMASVGSTGSKGRMSPHRMLTTSIADQNRLHTQFRGQSFGISLKDRGAILPAGHTANAAYWFNGGNEGKFITSSFYMEKLPKWIKEFNKNTNQYFRIWDTLKPIETYIESGSDLNNYENGFKDKETATFPYDLMSLKDTNDNYDILKDTPFGNDMLTDFAKSLIENENLGQDTDTDFLTISYSSTDYIGHNFGVNSKEVQDTYVRLDLNIANLISFLNKKVGKNNYTLFLTSDHGAVHVPSFLQDHNIPSGYFDTKQLRRNIFKFVKNKFGDSKLVEGFSSNEIFFDYNELEKQDIEADDLQEALYYHLMQYDNIDRVYTREMLEFTNASNSFDSAVEHGFHPKRSGDILYILEPAVISYPKKGSTHGSYLSYDTQAPLLLYGKGITAKQSFERYHIKDIAPTISALLGIAQPNGTTGTIIIEALD